MKINKWIIALLMTAGCATAITETPVRQTNYTHQISIQFIIARDDNGEGPAAARINEDDIKCAFEAAGIRLNFLPIKYYDSSLARDGEKNVNVVEQQIIKDKIAVNTDSTINVFFVKRLNGNSRPCGLSRMGGWIALIVQGETPERYRDAFVIAHEAAHVMGLDHTAGNPELPEINNLMGGGDFAKRINKTALVPMQVEIIKKSQHAIKL